MPREPRPPHPGRVVFANRLRELRLDAHMTQEQVAHRADLDRSFYVDIEHGRHSVSLDRILDIADALDVEPASLFQRSS
ncbi:MULTISPECIES: helix-turn-helix domain-containing protein [Dermacoccus]|uniref:helix-turn-helix domain-containing protein n=1 Tax=Dermacoccus TaxID=57495 RepID=UPI00057101C7|nr:helix-turn-helix transcriptional regulator [Dermacoccus nishinomiyaensis]